MPARAVVFAYHDVGVRCLSVLIAAGLRVELVVTHDDAPGETIWFASVERLAREHGLEVAKPADPAAIAPRLAALAPDFLFSFYYRHMLPAAMLGAARRGAFNVHGSLLPAYRGRVPVNWAILEGARETGATLHEMVARPDAGRIVDQMAVPILPDDLAVDVFRKVTVAAEIVLHRSLPALVAGTARLREQDLGAGGYRGARRPGDGRIDWAQPARRIHDLVRAVAPPYPGAFTALGDARLRLLRTRVAEPVPGAGPGAPQPRLAVDGDGRLVARCADGVHLVILEAELDGLAFGPRQLLERYGREGVRLGESPP